jgi:hypothetical protein
MTIQQQSIKELSLALAERDERIAALEEVYEMLNDLSKMSGEDVRLYIENSSDISKLLAKARGE